MRLKYVLNEVLVGLWRNVTMTIAMIITLTVSLTMLGASVLLYLQVDEMKDVHYGRIEVSVFLRDDVTDAQRTSLQAALQRNPLVKSLTYENREQAYARFQRIWSDSPVLVTAVRPGALPESFRVKLKDPETYDKLAAQLKDQSGIGTIVDQRELLSKVFAIFGSVQKLALVIAVTMAVAALLLVANTIQVAAYSKRREVAVMKLVGASNWFVQAPFVLEAMAAGVIGSIVAFAALYAGRSVLFGGPSGALTTVLTPIPEGNMWLMLPLLAAVGAGVSGITAWFTLRFYLRV
ncbi:permease-like cell division protein FtsX [Jidongwangia harbinensis]|uniref:permease-like cell division protein FtsX n=1 Tax=Jidongwangia harbinensis TaxID=2878561 RepID=UPI001CDA2034|nr:permease-like cell division protein FtsX [Jidongwangia harbinensis]MCA2211593.1 permease-like cell division protein FtsX [Jidongwangia harbinensis]